MPVYTELQPVFDKIWQEFVVNKRPQAKIIEVGVGGCVYRGNLDAHSDIRCALGVCIPDDMYDPKLDEHGFIYDIKDVMPEWFEKVFNGINVGDLSDLQQIHDDDFKKFEEEMRLFAEDHNLTIPE